MNKPRTIPKVATIVIHKLIVVDVRSVTDYTSIYGKMFIADDFYLRDPSKFYNFFVLSTVTPSKDKLTSMDLLNNTGTKLQATVEGLSEGIIKKTGLAYVPRVTDEVTRNFFKKGVSIQLWGKFTTTITDTDIEGVVDDRSRVWIRSVRSEK